MSSKKSQILLLGAYYILKQRNLKKCTKREMWVHPLLAQRLLKGCFTTLSIDLRESEKKFFNYFRMSIKSFDELLFKLQSEVRVSNNARASISHTERLCVALRYVYCLLNYFIYYYSVFFFCNA
jgi:hypothetical protein